jgi:hypothetical protein
MTTDLTRCPACAGVTAQLETHFCPLAANVNNRRLLDAWTRKRIALRATKP